MQLWFILACMSTIMIVASSFCAKWSQSLGTSVVDYVAGRIFLQTIIVACAWILITSTDAGRVITASEWGKQVLRASPISRGGGAPRWSAFRNLFGWPQLVTALLFTCLSLTAVAAIQMAPNPGYASSVLSTSAVFVAFLSPLIFPSVTLSARTLFGMLLVVAGISIVALTSSEQATG